jgi:hypothetical protein
MRMNLLFDVLGIWGIADGIWLLFRPGSWANFWGRWIGQIGRGGLAPRLVGVLEIGLSAAMIMVSLPRERASRTASWGG